MTSTASEALVHSLAAIEAAEIQTDPYNLIEIDGIFPADYYARMLEMFPRPESMLRSTETVFQADLVVDPGVERFADGRLLIDRRLKETDANRFAFWDNFRSAYFSDAFVNALLGKFSGQLDPEDAENCYAVGRLAIDQKGSGLGPHRDRMDKIASMLFYLAPEDDPAIAEPCGTMLLRKKDGWSADDRHYSFEGFEHVRTSPYRPNRLMGWAVSRDPAHSESFHAYHQSIDYDRKVIKFFVQKRMPLDQVRAHIASTKKHAADWRAS